MKNMKMGFIVQILKQDNLGVIREESTLTEWFFFLDEASDNLQIGATVGFYRAVEYEQFMATGVQRVNSHHAKMAV